MGQRRTFPQGMNAFGLPRSRSSLPYSRYARSSLLGSFQNHLRQVGNVIPAEPLGRRPGNVGHHDYRRTTTESPSHFNNSVARLLAKDWNEKCVSCIHEGRKFCKNGESAFKCCNVTDFGIGCTTGCSNLLYAFPSPVDSP